jgi:ornithine cyclodeaminase
LFGKTWRDREERGIVLKIIDKDEVFRIFSMKDCIAVMKQALIDATQKKSVQYLRNAIFLPESKILGFMPAYLNERYFGAKIITVFKSNIGTEFPSHQGYVMLFDSIYGNPLALVDGYAITKIRTGAVSAVTTDILARKDARRFAFLGAGEQARSHLEAFMLVRKIEEVSVYDIDSRRAKSYAEEVERKYGISAKVADCVRDAVADADVITTITTSHEPLIGLSDVKPGVHINAVGACTPKESEIAPELVAAARFFGDNRESVFNESGDFLNPLKAGRIDESHYLGDIGALLTGEIQGRVEENDITLFEALGLAVEDVASACFIYEKSR